MGCQCEKEQWQNGGNKHYTAQLDNVEPRNKVFFCTSNVSHSPLYRFYFWARGYCMHAQGLPAKEKNVKKDG